MQDASVDNNGSRDAASDYAPLRAESGDERLHWTVLATGLALHVLQLNCFGAILIATCSEMESGLFTRSVANASSLDKAGCRENQKKLC